MNIKEREDRINAIKQWQLLLSNTSYFDKNGDVKQRNSDLLSTGRFKFDWDKLTKPPLYHYITGDCIFRLEEISNNVKLMNNPNKRFKIQNDILKLFGFHPLNSGTNRRAFYCEYDPTIVLKLGSDKIGRSDNLSEFYLQNIIKPFCTKVFDVTPTGSCSLVERVDTMSKKDYAQWADGIFKLIMAIYYNGYIMEDVGANFFKNWGVRLGFGPVLLDFPYIFEVDYSKLKCTRRDPFTNVVCGGEIDYDYDGGMSQLICEKCGARYTAKHLARRIPSEIVNNIERKKDYSMALMNTNVKVYITKTNLRTGETTVVNKYFDDSDTRQTVNLRETKPYIDKNVRQQLRRDERNNNSYPPNVRKDLNKFLCDMEDKYGKRVSVDMAKKLGFRYEQEKRPSLPKEEVKGEEDNSSPLSYKDKAQRYKNMQHDAKVLKEVDSRPKQEDIPKSDISNRPTTGLFPMKPKSAEELEKEELEERNETAVMGFLGESGVEKIKRMDMIPKLKSMTVARFNGFEGNTNDDALGDKLASNVKEFISEDLNKLLGTLDGVEVKCTKTNDNLNRICYHTLVTNYGSVLYDCNLYTKDELENTNKEDNSVNHIKELLMPDLTTNSQIKKDDDKKISDSLPMTENELRVFFEDQAINFDFDKYEARDKHLQEDLEKFLLNKLLDKVNTVPFPLAQRKANEYVEMYYPLDTEDISSEL